MKLKLGMYGLLLLVLGLVSSSCMFQTGKTLNLPGVRLVAGSDLALREPSWSPNGVRLATVNLEGVHGGSPSSEVYVVDVTTGQIEQITHKNVGLPSRQPTWSYDGNQIAYYSSGEQQGEGIYLIDLNTGVHRPLAAWANNGALSPKGKQIAIWGPTNGSSPEPNWKLSILDLVTSKEQAIFQIKADSIDLRGLSWSRDGQKIALSMPSLELLSSNATRDWYNIYTLDADGRNLKQVTNNVKDDAISPTWSPAGDYIAYARGSEFRQSYLWVMNADGSCPVQLLDVAGINTPAWSPDGRYIAFEYEGGLYTLDLKSDSIVERMKRLNCK